MTNSDPMNFQQLLQKTAILILSRPEFASLKAGINFSIVFIEDNNISPGMRLKNGLKDRHALGLRNHYRENQIPRPQVLLDHNDYLTTTVDLKGGILSVYIEHIKLNVVNYGPEFIHNDPLEQYNPAPSILNIRTPFLILLFSALRDAGSDKLNGFEYDLSHLKSDYGNYGELTNYYRSSR